MTSSYAMSSKAKAMFGQRLTMGDYDNLVSKKTVAEVANYLKNDTYYAMVLKGINDTQVHRGELESLIRKDLFERFSRLIRYGYSNEGGLYRYGIIISEIDQLLACVKTFQTNEKLYMVAGLPLYLEHLMSFDIKKLVEVHNMEELVRLLEHSPYYDVLKHFASLDNSEIDIASIEVSLNSYYSNTVNKIISKDKTIKDKMLIQDMFNTKVELDNIVRIYRLKKYFNAHPDEIVKSIVPKFYHIKQKKLIDIIYNTSSEEFLEALQQTYYGRFLENEDLEFIELLTKKIIYRINKRAIYFSNDPNIVLLAYMNLCEMEINNIIEIIEGARYNVAKDKIKSLLVV